MRRAGSIGVLIAGAGLLCSMSLAYGQSISSATMSQLRDTIGVRAEALLILAGQQTAPGGSYSLLGNKADFDIVKGGARTDIGTCHSIANSGLSWNPMIEGTFGYLSSVDHFNSSILAGNELDTKIYSMEFGGGARLRFNDQISIGGTTALLYSRVKESFSAGTPTGIFFQQHATGGSLDRNADVLTVIPTVDLRYRKRFGNTVVEFTSTAVFFQTFDLSSSAQQIAIEGNSQFWENKLDIDAGLPLSIGKVPLRTGGFFSRTEIFGDASPGLESDHFYTIHGRLVGDTAGKLWKVRWMGVGGSYFWANGFSGWTIGVDMALDL